MTAHGQFHWNELLTWDAARAKRFYSATLGWTYEDMPMDGQSYHVCIYDGKPVAGIFQMPKGKGMDGVPENWFAYISVDDLDARLALLVKNGGRIMREPFEVPGVGRIAIVADDGGAAMGWMVPMA